MALFIAPDVLNTGIVACAVRPERSEVVLNKA